MRVDSSNKDEQNKVVEIENRKVRLQSCRRIEVSTDFNKPVFNFHRSCKILSHAVVASRRKIFAPYSEFRSLLDGSPTFGHC